jgi:hypothetical protein
MRKDIEQIAKEALIITAITSAIYCAVNSKAIISQIKEKANNLKYEICMTIRGITVYNSVH